LAAVVYSYTLAVLVLLFLSNVLVSFMGDWGYVATAALIYWAMRSRVRKEIPRVRGWYWKAREEYMRWKMTGKQRVAAAAVAFVLIVPPFSATVASDFYLEPGVQSVVRSSVSGEVTQVYARPGDAVHKGELLAELSNPGLTADAAELASELGTAEANVRSAEERSARDAQSRAGQERSRLGSALAMARAKVAGLEILAPVDGAIAARGTEVRSGEYLNEGQEFAQIVDRSTMRARILVHDSELEYVKVGAPVRLQVRAHAYRSYEGHIERILPAAAADLPISQSEKLERHGQELTNYVAVEMRFPNPDGSLIEGMTGTAKISGRRRPLLWSAGEAAWRWIRTQIW
jgi:multidrug resistance efflux pump